MVEFSSDSIEYIYDPLIPVFFSRTMDVRRAIARELHKPARRNFDTRRVTLKGVNDLYQADLVEMIPYARLNKGYRYVLTMINCLSKFAFAIPLKSKTGVEVAAALEPILEKHPMKHFQTDQGKEWFNVHVRKLMRKYGINHYTTYTDKKASICERLNRTLKTRMFREFTARGSYEWIELLKRVVRSYNNTVHSAIGMKPSSVTGRHEKMLLTRVNGPPPGKGKGKKEKPAAAFRVDDVVRISKYKKTFAKGYLPNWTNEVFSITAVVPTKPTTYILQDSKGQILKGGFYAQEISKSSLKDVYLVEKVLRKKGNKVFVKWQGFDKTHNSWVDKRDLVS